MTGSKKNVLLSSLKLHIDRSFLVIAADNLEAKKIYDDYKTFMPDCYLLPCLEKEDVPLEYTVSFCQLAEDILRGKPVMAVTMLSNVEYGYQELKKSLDKYIRFKVGETIDLKDFCLKLTEAGYTREEATSMPGEFSIRGGIVDLFPYQSEKPLRLELFDDEIDSLRYFDPLTQRSISKEEEYGFYLLGKDIFQPGEISLVDWFHSGIVVLDEPNSWTKPNFYLDKKIKPNQSIVAQYLTNAKDDVVFQSSVASAFSQKLDVLAAQLKEWRKHNRVVLFAATKERRNRLEELLQGEGIGITKEMSGDIGEITILEGNIQEGFHDLEAQVVVVADQEIFGVRKKAKQKGGYRQSYENGLKISSITDLQEGDYVVHLKQGIGQYLGIETIADANGLERDYLSVIYRDGGKLFIPVDQMDNLQRYVGMEGKTPQLSRLGGTEWHKARKKASESVTKLAENLLQLYAQREMSQGYAFSPDDMWQRSFDDAFPYEETPDQLKAIEEVKADMQKPQVMDRLLCGDVGYGKTEVAMRAAFKAVNDGKQVAVLVPTTILAQQHYNTFRERFKDFPFEIEMISRFRTVKERSEITKNVSRGTVDIIIGTHSLVKKDMEFKDLGLIIVDEEQRFGVNHKEKLKRLQKNVDTLTLTATPIPRTLYMSLVNIRGMSVIETPPENRFPIQTYISEYDPKTITEAIRYELERQGQVYFLHNRVESIDEKALEIGRLVPEARIATAHGQMSETELENVMWSFIQGEIDVLVCTTIIETGLDVPNVNTLIIDQADYIGLASLYQLRGRVGRSDKVAYAYLTYRKNKQISEVAQKRLKVMRDFTALGSGFKIAMHDLEIRGAGNILGAEQHGHMINVGFELYAKMLEQEIRRLKNETEDTVVTVRTAIEVSISAYLPNTYVKEQRRKIEIYKKIANALDIEEVNEVEDELIDRYGDLPEATQNMLAVAKVRVLAEKMQIQEVKQMQDRIVLSFHGSFRPNDKLVDFILGNYRGRMLLKSQKGLQLIWKMNGASIERTLGDLEKLLTGMVACLREQD